MITEFLMHHDDSGGSNKPVLSLKKMNGVLMAELFCA